MSGRMTLTIETLSSDMNIGTSITARILRCSADITVSEVLPIHIVLRRRTDKHNRPPWCVCSRRGDRPRLHAVVASALTGPPSLCVLRPRRHVEWMERRSERPAEVPADGDDNRPLPAAAVTTGLCGDEFEPGLAGRLVPHSDR